MARGVTKFHLDHVLVRMAKASEPMAAMIATQIQARAKVNIQRNGQIDTGFMLNSTYTVTKKASTFGQANQSGDYTDKRGQKVGRKLVRQAQLPSEALAATAVGAEYAIWQEERKPFLYPACVEAAKDSGLKADAQKVFVENLRD
ncbi:MAG TPA: hypothetical protein VJL10_05070 [Anaerolineales bacterium]|nr:hypothetical protein [Anaerolineales bacterium]